MNIFQRIWHLFLYGHFPFKGWVSRIKVNCVKCARMEMGLDE